MLISPKRSPVSIGVNVMVNTQLAPAAKLAGQLFVSGKSGPEDWIGEMISGKSPTFVSVIVWGALVLPTP